MNKKDKKKKQGDTEKINETPANSKKEIGVEEAVKEDLFAELTKEKNELQDKYLRLMAEFDNYKKRTIKERIELMRTAAQDTLSALLPVLDDFDRAKKASELDNSTEPLSEGVLLVYNKLYSILKQRGLEPMQTDGQTFDPELHDALTEIPAPSEDMKGKIIETIEKGYFLNDKIIRHAKVVVGK